MRRPHEYRTITNLFGEPSQKSDANSSSVELNQVLGQLVAEFPGVIEFRDHQRIHVSFLRCSWRECKRLSTSA